MLSKAFYLIILSILITIHIQAQTNDVSSPWYPSVNVSNGFTYKSMNANAYITNICLNSGIIINSINSIDFSDETSVVNIVGGNGGSTNCYNVPLNECISKINIDYGSLLGQIYIYSLRFTTSNNAMSPVYGLLNGGNNIEFDSNDKCLYKMDVVGSNIYLTNMRFHFRNKPTDTPTNMPSISPSIIPTNIPTMKSDNPTQFTLEPTKSSLFPSVIPTLNPTNVPSLTPTHDPTSIPSLTPTNIPSLTPTHDPTNIPSSTPTYNPSSNPTRFDKIYIFSHNIN